MENDDRKMMIFKFPSLPRFYGSSFAGFTCEIFRNTARSVVPSTLWIAKKSHFYVLFIHFQLSFDVLRPNKALIKEKAVLTSFVCVAA